MEQLTRRQTQVLEFIHRWIDRFGYPPTRVNIAAGLGFRSPNAAQEHLRTLARKGAIEMIPNASRGIRLPSPPGLPLVGRVAAGNPILAEENVAEHIDVPATLFRPRATFMLRVRGQSMRDAGILDGDLLAVHKTETARNGQVVVARINDEVTVKHFHQDNRVRHRVTLLPANPDFDPIEIDLRKQSLVIEGLGVGVIRPAL